MITATMEGNAAAQDFLSHLPLKATLPFIPRGVTLQFSAFLACADSSSRYFCTNGIARHHLPPPADTGHGGHGWTVMYHRFTAVRRP